jgi:hypothetical protein
VFFIALAFPVNAYTKGTTAANISYELLTTDKYGTGVIYTPSCFKCDMPLEIKYGGSLSTASKSFTSANDMDYFFNKLNVSDDIKVTGYYLLKNETYNVTDIINVVCSDSFNCSKGTEKITAKWRWTWIPLPSIISINKNEPFVINIKGERTPTTKNYQTDLIPSILGYSLDNLAWWSSGWSNCKNLTITRYASDVVATNITGLKLTNSYEGRIVNASCNNGGTEQNFTVKSSATASASDDWLDVEFKAPTTNTTWSIYYNNPSAPNPSYYFLLFNPNLASNCDYTNDWYTGDTAKYACGSGMLNASKIDGGAYATDQLQTKNDYSGYPQITVWVVPYMTSASGAEHYTRYAAGTITQGAWDNYYNFLTTITTNNYRLLANLVVIDENSGITLLYQKNFSVKVQYSVGDDDAFLWLYNSSDYQLWNLNITTLNNDLKYWGAWVDPTGTGSTVRYYAFKIYHGYVNPSLTNLPSVALGSEESAPNTPPRWSSPANNTPTVYNSSFITIFNITWANGSATSVVNTTNVNLTANFSGAYQNYTMTLISGNSVSGVYGYQTILGAGVFNWSSRAQSNDTTLASNITSTYTITVSQFSSNCSLTITPTSPITYPTQSTATCYINNSEGAKGLFRNGANVTSTANNTLLTLGVATHSYVCNSTATQNYTSCSNTSSYVVNQGINLGYYNITNTTTTYVANTITGGFLTIAQDIYETYPHQTTVSASCSLSSGTLYRNGTNVSTENGVSLIRGYQYSNYTYECIGNANYTSNQSANYMNISKGVPAITVSFNSSTVIQGSPVNVSCTYPTEISVNFYNDTGTISNPFIVNTSSLLGTYNYTCNTTGNTNYTAGNGTGFLTVTSANGLSVSVYNEENTSQPLTFNITINNGTAANTAYNQGNPYINNTITGIITIDISSNGYQPRTYYATVGTGSVSVINASLLATGSGSWVIFYVYTYAEQPIPAALINVERLIPPSSWLTVAQKKTDAAGTAAIFLSPTTTYRFNVSAAGYDNSSNNLQPSSSPYVFYMTGSTYNINYSSIFKNIALQVEPKDAALVINQTYPFFYYINSSDSSLAFFGWNITYVNGTIITFSNITTNTSGGNLTYNINTNSWHDLITLNYWFKKTNASELFNATNYYYVYNVSYKQTSIMAEVVDLKSDLTQISSNQFAFISVLLSIIFMGAASSQFKMFGSGIFGIGCLAFFTVAGTYIYGSAYLIGWNMLSILAVGVIAAIMIRGGFG